MKYIKREYHGMCGTMVYRAWAHMKERCTNKNDMGYKNYGGRGIKVCEEWMSSFMAYYNFVSSLPNYGVKGYTLDRINNDKGYHPNNVKYSTRVEQNSNRRGFGISKYKGVSWDNNHNKWRTVRKINGKKQHIGYFTSEIEAAEAYKKALGEIVPL